MLLLFYKFCRPITISVYMYINQRFCLVIKEVLSECHLTTKFTVVCLSCSRPAVESLVLSFNFCTLIVLNACQRKEKYQKPHANK